MKIQLSFLLVILAAAVILTSGEAAKEDAKNSKNGDSRGDSGVFDEPQFRRDNSGRFQYAHDHPYSFSGSAGNKEHAVSGPPGPYGNQEYGVSGHHGNQEYGVSRPPGPYGNQNPHYRPQYSSGAIGPGGVQNGQGQKPPRFGYKKPKY